MLPAFPPTHTHFLPLVFSTCLASLPFRYKRRLRKTSDGNDLCKHIVQYDSHLNLPRWYGRLFIFRCFFYVWIQPTTAWKIFEGSVGNIKVPPKKTKKKTMKKASLEFTVCWSQHLKSFIWGLFALYFIYSSLALWVTIASGFFTLIQNILENFSFDFIKIK